MRATRWTCAVRLGERSSSTASIRAPRRTGSSRTRCATSSTRPTVRQYLRSRKRPRAAVEPAAMGYASPLPPFLTRSSLVVLCAVLLLPGVPGLRPGTCGAQAVPRTDTPRGGTLRLTFEPVITTWDYEFTPHGRLPIGASLPATVFVRQEQRVTPLQLEYGITNRIAIGFKAPLVRVNSRQSYNVNTADTPDSAGLALDMLLNDTTYAYGSLSPTPRNLHYFAGDMEAQAKYRFFETQVAQELTLFHRLWLNASVRLANQRPGTRDMRIGPQPGKEGLLQFKSRSELLLPHAALAKLNWDPGDYVALDLSPLYRFSKFFAAGFTAGYYAKQSDHYSYQSAQDSIAVTTHMGGTPLAADLLDPGTSVRRWRLGVALTYMGPDEEGSASYEQTVSASAGERVPAATVFRIVMRLSRWPF